MAELPTIQGMRLRKVFFPHFDFECRETAGGELIAPRLNAALRVTRPDDLRYDAEIEFSTSAEEEASFRALIIARLEFTLAEEEVRPPTEKVVQFLQVNCLVLVWPYLRELVASATTRMGFPGLVIPMLDVRRIYSSLPKPRKPRSKRATQKAEGSLE